MLPTGWQTTNPLICEKIAPTIANNRQQQRQSGGGLHALAL
jgi:hypothetical protein